jgi:hypothetical protein
MAALEFAAVVMFGVATAWIVGTLAEALDSRYRRRAWRWLRWTVRCRRGARCARLVTLGLNAPLGAVVRMEYECGGCGTRYRGEAMAIGEDAWTETTRERVS